MFEAFFTFFRAERKLANGTSIMVFFVNLQRYRKWIQLPFYKKTYSDLNLNVNSPKSNRLDCDHCISVLLTKAKHSKHTGKDSEDGPTMAAWSENMISPGCISLTDTIYLKIVYYALKMIGTFG